MPWSPIDTSSDPPYRPLADRDMDASSSRTPASMPAIKRESWRPASASAPSRPAAPHSNGERPSREAESSRYRFSPSPPPPPPRDRPPSPGRSQPIGREREREREWRERDWDDRPQRSREDPTRNREGGRPWPNRRGRMDEERPHERDRRDDGPPRGGRVGDRWAPNEPPRERKDGPDPGQGHRFYPPQHNAGYDRWRPGGGDPGYDDRRNHPEWRDDRRGPDRPRPIDDRRDERQKHEGRTWAAWNQRIDDGPRDDRDRDRRPDEVPRRNGPHVDEVPRRNGGYSDNYRPAVSPERPRGQGWGQRWTGGRGRASPDYGLGAARDREQDRPKSPSLSAPPSPPKDRSISPTPRKRSPLSPLPRSPKRRRQPSFSPSSDSSSTPRRGSLMSLDDTPRKRSPSTDSFEARRDRWSPIRRQEANHIEPPPTKARSPPQRYAILANEPPKPRDSWRAEPPIIAEPHESHSNGSVKNGDTVKIAWEPASPIKAPRPAVPAVFDEPSKPVRRPSDARDAPRPPNDRARLDPDSIPPYLKAAFDAWFSQGASPAPAQFLFHYLGRQASGVELDQMDDMLDVRRRSARPLEEYQTPRAFPDARDHHPQRNGHALEPRRRETWSPPKVIAKRRAWGTSGEDEPPSTNGHTPDDPPPPPPPPETVPSVPPVEETKPLVNIANGEVYERVACVGEGTYGKVYKAKNAETGQLVALKRIRMEGEKDGFPVTAMREIKLLQGLRHRNVLRLQEMMVSKGSVYMVLDYMEHDLTGLLSLPSLSFSAANIKSLAHQMLSGLAYLHKRHILHRDMKGSNILLNGRGELKLADFGLARVFHKNRRADYTNRVITLWYRSPELLMGETMYGPEVDMWSAGCIILELFTTKPIFQGNDEIHQLETIYSVMGTPRESDWPTVTNLPWYELVKPKEAKASKFRDSFQRWLTPAAMDLAEGLLFFDPSKRLSAASALQAAYFAEEAPGMEMPTQLAGMGEHHEMSAKADRARRRLEEKERAS